jgi:prophage antirepressor-like protein
MKLNTARQLLNLVFEGHSIRTVFRDGKHLFVAKDVAAACEISAPRDIIKTHVDSDQLVSSSLDVRSDSGVVQKRELQFLTQSGVFALVMGSRKPAARRFQRWLADEVLPQLLQYGSYLPGATPAERLQALHRRWQQERAALIQSSEELMQEKGLMTLQAFRLKHDIHPWNMPGITRQLTGQAMCFGIRAAKLVLKGQRCPVNAWPEWLLDEAVIGQRHYLQTKQRIYWIEQSYFHAAKALTLTENTP